METLVEQHDTLTAGTLLAPASFGLLCCEVFIFYVTNVKLIEIGLFYLATFSQPVEVAPSKVGNYCLRYIEK